MKFASVILIAVLLAGCGPSIEQMTATAVVAQVQTQTAAPTFTPTATTTRTSTPTQTLPPTRTSTPPKTSTPTLPPTSTSTLTPTSSPTPSLPKIMGKIQLNIVPLEDNAILPKPPHELSMTISPTASDEEIRIQASDPDGNFTAYLEPGKYIVKSVIMKDDELSDAEVGFDAKPTNFNVPSEPCSYVGSFTFSIGRLPPGSIAEQIEMAQQLAKKTRVDFMVKMFEEGSFILPAAIRIVGEGACPEMPQAPEGFNWKYLPESSLAVLVPHDWYFKSESQNQTTDAYFISLESINQEGSFKTGYSIFVVQDNSLNAAQFANEYAAGFSTRENVVASSDVSERQDGNFLYYEFEYGIEETNTTYASIIHEFIAVNTGTNTLYLTIFESPKDQWDEAWQIGQVMIQQIQFLE